MSGLHLSALPSSPSAGRGTDPPPTGRRADRFTPWDRSAPFTATYDRADPFAANSGGGHPATGEPRWARSVEDGPFTPRHTGRDEIPRPRHADAGKGSSSESPHRVDTERPLRPGIIEMISDIHHPVMHPHNPLEIIEDEEAGKP